MQKQLTRKEKYSFGFGAFGKDLVVNLIGIYLMYYLTDILGVAASFVGTLYFVARIWDAINDPIMGMIVDKTKTKWGKFRPWLVIGTLVNSVITVLIFTNFHLEGTALYVFVSIMYIVWGMTYTMMDVPYWSWLPNLTNNPTEREEVSVLPRIFASLANLILGALGLTIVIFLDNLFGNGDQSTGFLIVAVITIIIFNITIGITVKNVHEAPTNIDTGITLRFKDIWRILFTNKELLAYIGMILTFFLCGQLIGNVMIYYFSYVTESKFLFSLYNGMGFMEIIALFLFPKIAKWLSRERVYPIATISIILGLLVILVAGYVAPKAFIPVILGTSLIKIGSGLIMGIITVSIADVIDYSEMKFGQRNESVITSTQTFLMKTAMAFSGLATGWSLTLLGYQPGQEQSELTKNGLRVIMVVLPIICVTASFAIYKWSYHLKGTYIKDIVNVLNNRKSQKG
ncbi:melibiose:sodium transporter MelB [Staphylococcus gallinarum]|uniref:Melibiose carrier protein n=2 Tax=Staphylococcus gallinarum TaxID=1293 RepID=A0A0D0QZW1_STAGA|nr:melibiose:sodium transporter MelB [Staphylococcus gallinarum]KIR12646.1 melibiose:sodium symporter [Staphylococcus gallinarum]MCD8820751.1 melibiose:sodium transporter MelB [Staphylococcus gallinarum]MCD8826329.1 melibiose:sodium transporter MelB [Staphylococcus gallinarum]MCD8871467.1 melibiose:sodium transporter MelB [Staphylococcus gallinarum]MCD8899482.1 melibiose:sodium transporter MelB [Staphylococcus gallinarum]